MALPTDGLAILHISDLHFGPYLQGVGRIGEWASFAVPHSFNLLLGMEAKVPEVLRDHEGRLLIALTGDMTTAAEPPAYEAVNNYLRDRPYVSSTMRVGLGLDNLYAVPGNHDVWLYGGLFSKWKRYMNRKDEYSRYFTEPLPYAYPLMVNAIPVTLFTVDSNRVKGGGPFDFNFENTLGRGEVGNEQIAAIQALHANLVNNTFPNVPAGFEYDRSLKVVIMHHHLAIPSDVSRDLEQKLLELKDAEMVLEAFCAIGMHMVLCGHQHFPYRIPELKPCPTSQRAIFLSCAGSATQIGCERNSFCIYEINDASTTWQVVLRLFETSGRFAFKEGDKRAYAIPK